MSFKLYLLFQVYEYHQKHGFTVMMLQELLELIQFIFMILFTVFLVECIDYPLLFKDKLPADYKGEKLRSSTSDHFCPLLVISQRLPDDKPSNGIDQRP